MEQKRDISGPDRGGQVIDLSPAAGTSAEFIVRLDAPENGCTCLTDRIQLQGWFLAGDGESSEHLRSSEAVSVLIEEHRERPTSLYGNMNFCGRRVTPDGAECRLETLRVSPAATDQFGPLAPELGAPWCIDAVLDFGELQFSPEQDARTFVVLLRLEHGDRVSTSNPVCFSIRRPERRAEALGGIEFPSSGALAADFLVVEGWAMKPGDRVASAGVYAGAVLLGSAATNLPSPAQAKALPFLEETRNCRFALGVCREGIPLDLTNSFPLSVRVGFESGAVLELRGPQFLWQPAPRGDLSGELETIRVVEEGLVEVAGWACSASFEPPRFYLEGRTWRVELPEVLRTAREDIARRIPSMDRNEPLGFSARFHPELLGRVPGTVELTAENSAGRIVLSSASTSAEITRRISGLISPGSDIEAAKAALSRALSRAGIRKKFPSPRPVPRAGAPERIVFASHNLSPMEGAPRVLFEIVRGLVGSGADAGSFLVIAAYGGELAERFEHLGVGVEIRNDLRAHDQTWERYHSSLAGAAERIRSFGADFVFANVVDTFWAPDAARRLRLPSFWLLHESVDPLRWFSQLEPRLRLLFLGALAGCPRVGFVAEETRRLFSAVVPSERSTVIANGVDEAAIAHAAAEWPRVRARAKLGVGDELVVTIVGTTTPRKGQDIFLRELAELRRLRPSLAFRAFIVGARKGEYLSELERAAKAHGLEGAVTFVPETREVAPYYMGSDILVIASREESAPLVSLEAFAYGRPLVSTAVYGLAEQVAHERNALVFDAAVDGALARALLRLRDESALAARLVSGGAQTLRDKFSLESSRRRYREEIESTFRLFT